MEIPNNYGLLINKDIKLHRTWFKQMVKLLGINCIYRAPRPEFKTYNKQGDLDSRYFEPELVGCIFSEHPDQKTLKKLGWVAELSEGSSIIHVPYDLPHLQVGALFTVPSGIDNGTGRTFRVISMQTGMIYPASIACEIALEYETTTPTSNLADFTSSTLTLLKDIEGED